MPISARVSEHHAHVMILPLIRRRAAAQGVAIAIGSSTGGNGETEGSLAIALSVRAQASGVGPNAPCAHRRIHRWRNTGDPARRLTGATGLSVASTRYCATLAEPPGRQLPASLGITALRRVRAAGRRQLRGSWSRLIENPWSTRRGWHPTTNS